MKIVEEQLVKRDMFEILMGALFHKFQELIKDYHYSSNDGKQKSREIQYTFKQIIYTYKTLNKDEEYIDCMNDLSCLADSFKIKDMLKEIILFLNLKDPIYIPQNYKNKIPSYFEGILNIKTYE